MPDHCLSRPAASAAALCAVFAGACSAAPPEPPRPAPRPPSTVVAAALPPPPPARWIVSKEEGDSEPFAGGKVELVGGRRLLIAKDGSARWQTADLPLPLDWLVAVPSAGGPRLVGATEDTLYRFDDPLGEGTALVGGLPPLSKIRAMPGLVALWARGSVVAPFAARFFSLETGKEGTPTTLPDFPLTDVEFTDLRHGAAIFDLWGLGLSHDGGATWQRPRTAGQPVDVLDATTFADVDIEAGTLGDPFAQPAAPAPSASPAAGAEPAPSTSLTAGAGPAPNAPPAEAPIWPGESIALDRLVGSGGDPLALAALAGVAAPDGGAWIEWRGHVVRIDLRTTAATVVAKIPGVDGKPTSWCRLARAGSDLWIGCKSFASGGPFTIVRATPKEATLVFGAPSILDFVDPELRASRSGGVLAFVKGNGPTVKPPRVSVRQPNGEWVQHPIRWGTEESAGALADGRVATLENPRPGKEPPHVVVTRVPAQEVVVVPPGSAKEVVVPPGSAKGAVVPPPPGSAKEVAVTPVAATEEEEVLPPLALLALSIIGPIEEDAEHVLHFVVQDQEGPIAVAQPLDGAEARLTRVPGAFAARLQAGRGIALGKRSVLASSDSGMTWNEVPAPPHLLDRLAKPEGIKLADGDAAALRIRRFANPSDTEATRLAFAAGEVGAMVGDHLRLGWGDAEPLPAAPRAALASWGGADSPPVAGKLHALSCRDGGAAAAGLSPGDYTWRDFGKGKLPEGATVDDLQMHYEATQPYAGLAGGDPFAGRLLYLETPPEEPPQKWLARWLDPTEIGSRGRNWQGNAPDFAPYAARIKLTHPAPGVNRTMRMPLVDSGMAGHAARDGRVVFYVSGAFMEPGGFDDSAVSAGMLVRVSASGAGQTSPLLLGNSREGPGAVPRGTRAGRDRNDATILDDRRFSVVTNLTDVGFGRGPGAPIAGILSNHLFVWFEGKPVQPIARLPDVASTYPTRFVVGEPSADGVPLLALSFVGAFQRVGLVPIPKTTADPPLLDGVAWKRPPVPLRPERLPPCAATAKGMSFRLRSTPLDPPLRVLFDGVELTTLEATYDVLVSESEACLVRASVTAEPKDGSEENQRFVRADFAGKRAEGGLLQGPVDGPKAKVRKLSCAWIEDEKK